jgi:hypothetical protein
MNRRCRIEHCQILFGLMSWLLVGECWLALGFANAQESPDRGGDLAVRTSSAGTNAYVSGKWSVLRLNLTNPTRQPVEVLAATYFEDEPTLQFGRRVWMPAMSRLQTWHPILLPESSAAGREKFEFRTLVMNTAQQREVLIRSDSGALQWDGMFRANDGRLLVGLIDRPRAMESERSTAPFDLVMSASTSIIRNGDVMPLTDRLLPVGEECWQTLDQLVIADAHVVEDGAGVAAIRRWLYGGGSLWLMLDRTDSPLLEQLLGDESPCQVVDRVGLTTVRLEVPTPNGSVSREAHDHERPVEFVRVLTSDVDVVCTIGGWPAAFWKNCGEGRLLVTTLGAEGWMRKRTAADPRTEPNVVMPSSSQTGRESATLSPAVAASLSAPAWQSPFFSLGPMQELAPQFFRARAEPRLARTNLEPLVQEYVGYSIPARWQVICLLLGFSGLVATVGWWLWRRSRLEIMGIISPVLAISFSTILVGLGWLQRQSVPPAVASLQFVRAVPGTDDVRVEGVAGLFSPEVGVATAGSKNGGWLLPDMTGQQGTTRRMVWTDLEEWQWENVPEAAGLMNATLLQSGTLAERLEARATFGPDGLTGRLQASAARDPTDAVLATRSGRIGVQLRDDGTFVVRSDAVFTDEQFLGAKLLSDEQHRRQRVLMSLLNDSQRRDYPGEPQLLFWSKPWHLGFQFAQNRQTLGSALVAVPLKLDRPPTGTEVSLAAPLLPYREAVGPDGIVPTGLWDHRSREWQEKAFPTANWLRFQIPTVLLPVTVQRGRLVIRVAGPVVRLEVAGLRANLKDIVPIKTWNDPVGTLSWELTDSEALSLSADGGLLLRVSAGDPKLVDQVAAASNPDVKLSYWRIESLALELDVKTAEAQ